MTNPVEAIKAEMARGVEVGERYGEEIRNLQHQLNVALHRQLVEQQMSRLLPDGTEFRYGPEATS